MINNYIEDKSIGLLTHVKNAGGLPRVHIQFEGKRTFSFSIVDKMMEHCSLLIGRTRAVRKNLGIIPSSFIPQPAVLKDNSVAVKLLKSESLAGAIL